MGRGCLEMVISLISLSEFVHGGICNGEIEIMHTHARDADSGQ